MRTRTAPQLFLLMYFTSAASADIINLQGISGEIGYQYSNLEAAGSSMHANRYQGNLNAKGYLWQPWFITTNAGLIVAMDDSENNGNTHANQLYAGNIDVTALPLSLYPFNLHVSRTDSYLESSPENVTALASGDVSLSDHQTTNELSVVQRFMGKRSRTELLYNTSDTTTDTHDDNSELYGITHHVGYMHHSFDLSANSSDSSNSDGIANEGTSARASYRYRPSDHFDIHTEASSTASQYSRIIPLAAESYIADTNINQVLTTLNFRSTDRKLHSNANIRYIDFDQQAINNNVSSDTFSTSTHANIYNNYDFTQYISGSLGGGASTTKNEAGEANSSNQNLALTAHTPIYNLLSHDYSANSTVGTSYTHDDNASDRLSSASFGHSAQKSININRRTNLRYSLGQSYSYSKSDAAAEADESLSYSFNTSFSHSTQPTSLTASAAYSYTESLTTDDNSRNYNINALLDNRLSNHSSVNVSLSHQAFYSSYSNVVSDYTTQSLKANYTFRKRLDFSVLTFRSEASVVKTDSTTTTSDTLFWRNNLSYVIGKVSASIDYQLQNRDGDTFYSFYFNIKRGF